MKTRRFTLAMLAAAMSVAAGTASAQMSDKPLTIIHPMDAKFRPVPNAATCNTMASLRGNLSKEASTFTSRMTPGCVAPWHWHSSTEEVVMLQGTARMQMENSTAKPMMLPTGSYSQLPREHLHRFKCLPGKDCVILVITDRAFDIHWVDKSRKEIPFEQALKLEKASPAW
jgi:quercetin dioxygenase-like cupin family protein